MSINGLEITDVVIFPMKKRVKGNNLAAFARLVLNDQFIVSGIRIYEENTGPIVSFPRETCKSNGKSYEIVFPITMELRFYLISQVLNQYKVSKKCIQKGNDWHQVEDRCSPSVYSCECHVSSWPKIAKVIYDLGNSGAVVLGTEECGDIIKIKFQILDYNTFLKEYKKTESYQEPKLYK